MTLAKLHARVVYQCDAPPDCDAQCFTGEGDVPRAAAIARAKGWRIAKGRDGRWRHYCVEHS